jgi:hypothetical protein
MTEEFKILIAVVLMCYLHHELIYHSLSQYLSFQHEGTTMLLNFGIVKSRFDHITIEFERAPHTFDLKRVIEGKLFMDESEGVVGPVMIVAVLRKF